MEYLEKMKTIQNKVLEYIDDDSDEKQIFDDLIKLLLEFQQNQIDIQEFRSFLYLISKISKNHRRNQFFFDKIKKIINHLKKEIKQTFSNSEIFNIFKSSKRILLLLIDEKILIFDSEILSKITKYKEYFSSEINNLNQDGTKIELPEHYEENRRKGENESYLCEMIRNDDIVKFTIYCTKNPISVSINPSIYETNSFLINKSPNLIEYSAFYGSIQIFRYLLQNQVDLPPSLWIYAIHGQNPDIIHLLEENQIKPEDESYQECLKESIKCHHNDFAMYFKSNFMSDVFDDLSNYSKNEFYYGFRYYNFQFISSELNQIFFFYYAIQFDYFKLVEYFKNIEKLDINESIIKNIFFNDTSDIIFKFNDVSKLLFKK